MNKSKLFLILIFSFLISCTNPAKPSRNNLGSGNTNTKPSWFLTDEEQKTAQMIHTITLGHTTSDPKQYYRIPAILLTKKNTIIAAFDNRKKSNDDIGWGNCDLIEPTVRRSTNGGKTWSDNIRVGKIPTEKKNAHGDPVLFEHTPTGNLVMLSATGGAFRWDTEQKSRIAVSISTDDGLTWSDWKEVQGDIFTTGKLQQNGYFKGFAASGRGATLSDGTLVCALVVASKDGTSKIGVATYYSKDGGNTWQVGGLTQYDNNGYNEAKVIAEIVSGENKGKLLLSARPEPAEGEEKDRYWAVANGVDDNWKKVEYGVGLTDGRANAEGIRYTLKSNGHSKDRLLFINCNSKNQRTQLTLHMSEDEGKTWNTKKIIQPGISCYSSIYALPDGTIITFAEEPSEAGGKDNYNLVFRRFNLAWFTDESEIYSDTW